MVVSKGGKKQVYSQYKLSDVVTGAGGGFINWMTKSLVVAKIFFTEATFNLVIIPTYKSAYTATYFNNIVHRKHCTKVRVGSAILGKVLVFQRLATSLVFFSSAGMTS